MIISSVVGIVSKFIDKAVKDPQQAAQINLELARLAQEGQLRELEIQMSAIIAEAQSADPWTSRARPSFLYVMYVLMLVSIPMGILSAFDAETAGQVAAGAQAWLGAIPEGMWVTFGIGYSGYAIARSVDKTKGRS